jgi:hypothetical protein
MGLQIYIYICVCVCVCVCCKTVGRERGGYLGDVGAKWLVILQ